jgi:hypothetical protein
MEFIFILQDERLWIPAKDERVKGFTFLKPTLGNPVEKGKKFTMHLNA